MGYKFNPFTNNFDKFDAIPDGQLSFQIEVPEVKNYYLLLKASSALTIDSITTKTISGTATFTLKINSTAITGITTITADSTEVTTSATALNDVSVGDDIILEVTSVSTPVDFIGTLNFNYK